MHEIVAGLIEKPAQVLDKSEVLKMLLLCSYLVEESLHREFCASELTLLQMLQDVQLSDPRRS